MRSMTGMGAASARAEGAVLKVEIRSVNHRFFDFSLRAPSNLTLYEPMIRDRVAARLRRGRVTLSVDLDLKQRHGEVTVDDEYVASFLKAARRLARKHKLEGTIDVAQVVSLPEALIVRERGIGEKVLQRLVVDAVDKALDRLDAMRVKEGRALVRELRKRCRSLASHRRAVARKARTLPAELRRRLEDRLAEVDARAVVDPQRLAQEVVLLAEKATITEEIERLGSHLAQFEETLSADGPGAKRLGFLLQEMHREVNTMGSKSNDIAITDRVVRMKEEIENMREQIQNLE